MKEKVQFISKCTDAFITHEGLTVMITICKWHFSGVATCAFFHWTCSKMLGMDLMYS